MNQVRVLLRGGLGNQLFQYAAGSALAARNNAKLVLDLSWFDQVRFSKGSEVTKRAYALAPFEISSEIYRPIFSDVHGNFLGRRGISHITRYAERFRRKLRSIPSYRESGYLFESEFFEITGSVEIDGYWQSEKYFSSIASQIRSQIGSVREVSPETRRMLKLIGETDSICVHVRRGDYVSNRSAADFHGTCSIAYYKDAIAKVACSMADPVCYFFSDDLDWVRREIRLDIPSVMVDINGPNQAHQDLWLMAACRSFVIANSSLSWWGAWLGYDNRKIVIAPSKWFLLNEKSTVDLLPATWIKM